MILKKIVLENIRSYIKEEVNFPEGSLLLSGNIGSGKSTILLAIDFVLFGLTRSVLSGNALLRNGKDQGSVELHFRIDNKDIILKRNLKRTADSIAQDTGYVIINGIKKDLSATELKQIVLTLLNYPQELLTKSKSLIYRYTVYTPQEEMKQILLGDKDIRLDTLRRVFGIDKYKRIIENSSILTSKLKEKKKEFLGRIEDLERKKQERELKLTKFKGIEQEHSNLVPHLTKTNRDVSNKQLELGQFEEKIMNFNNWKKENEFTLTLLNEKTRKLKELDLKIGQNKNLIEKFQLEIKPISKIDDSKLLVLEKEILSLEKEDRELIEKLSEIKSKILESQKLNQNILTLNNCPTCKQKVNEDHKKHITDTETKKIKELEENSKLYKNRQEEVHSKLSLNKKEVENLKQLKKEIDLNKLKLENLNDKKIILENLIQDKTNLEQEISNLNSKKERISQELENLKDVEEFYIKIKKELEELQNNLKHLEIKEATLLKEKQNLDSQIEELTQEILRKTKTKENILHLSKVQDWLENSFIILMRTMEKQIMLRVHTDFNDLFKKWFDILVDSENLQINLDEEFTPKIQQIGYEIDYTNLSGGEKTAAALAYRLALNQVINNLMSDVKTRDLLILDEPTDGFSDEQLDKMKLVLDELNIKQVIIVSHESKIESFVNNVIKIEKKDHISKVL